MTAFERSGFWEFENFVTEEGGQLRPQAVFAALVVRFFKTKD